MVLRRLVWVKKKAADNKFYTFKMKDNNKWLYTSEIRSVPDWKVISPKQIYMMVSSKQEKNGYGIFVNLPAN